jgi:hypothetical protein
MNSYSSGSFKESCKPIQLQAIEKASKGGFKNKVNP